MKGRIEYQRGGQRFFVDDTEVTPEEFEAAFPSKLEEVLGGDVDCLPSQSGIGWPIHSEALAYHPKQKAEAEAHFQKLGVPTEVDTRGRPVLRDRMHRKQVLKALGMHDRTSFLGY